MIISTFATHTYPTPRTESNQATAIVPDRVDPTRIPISRPNQSPDDRERHPRRVFVADFCFRLLCLRRNSRDHVGLSLKPAFWPALVLSFQRNSASIPPARTWSLRYFCIYTCATPDLSGNGTMWSENLT